MAERTVAQIRVDDATQIPVVTWTASAAGPVVVIVAGVHGDELVGTLACGRMDGRLRQGLTAGTVHMIPCANPAGLTARTRTVGADGGDLNRSFPGVGRSRTDRLAAALWRDLLAREPDAVLDLHADTLNAIPYAIVDRAVSVAPPGRAGLEHRATALAAATGLTVLHEYPIDVYQRFGLDKSLAGAVMNKAHRPAITLEVGPRRVVDPDAAKVMVEAVFGVLHALGCGFAPATPHPTRLGAGPWRRGSGPRISHEGWLQPEVPAGGVVMAGRRIGWIRDLDGRPLEAVEAVQDGVVISWVDAGWVAPGQAVGTFAVAERG